MIKIGLKNDSTMHIFMKIDRMVTMQEKEKGRDVHTKKEEGEMI